MTVNITIEATAVWDYFHENKQELVLHMHQIASNNEYGIKVFVTENFEFPNIVVTADDMQVYEEMTASKKDCEKTVAMIYDKYLTDKVITVLLDEVENNTVEVEAEHTISEREDELDDAVMAFLTVVLDGYVDIVSDNFEETCEDIKEHFLEYIARKHNLQIRRPMYLEYEDGVEELEEYPYENMKFDDEDNPIYK